MTAVRAPRSEHRRWLRSLLPDDRELQHALAATIRGGASDVRLVERIRHDYASSFPAEIVRCRVGSVERMLLCKYEIEQPNTTHGHRSGVSYEAHVYRSVLEGLPLTTAPVAGTYADAETGRTWLFLDYLDDAVRADETSQPGRSLRAAARWAADFHALGAARCDTDTATGLVVYDREYYTGFSRRTALFLQEIGEPSPRVEEICAAFEALVDELLAAPPTIVHGEFTPHNVLIRDRRPYPVDWESAAVGCWAIDLVSLAQKWPARIVRACRHDYVSRRWPGADVGDVSRILDIAEMYWDFRWLGDRPEWLRQPKVRTRLAHLQVLSRRLGISS